MQIDHNFMYTSAFFKNIHDSNFLKMSNIVYIKNKEKFQSKFCKMHQTLARLPTLLKILA